MFSSVFCGFFVKYNIKRFYMASENCNIEYGLLLPCIHGDHPLFLNDKEKCEYLQNLVVLIKIKHEGDKFLIDGLLNAFKMLLNALIT